MWITAALLPIAYIIGMVFTFKTHTHIFEQEEEDDESGTLLSCSYSIMVRPHLTLVGEGAEWTIPVAVLLMLISVSCHALIAEDLVNVLETVLEEFHLKQYASRPLHFNSSCRSFLGITVIALTPAATEIANAIKFAIKKSNFALSRNRLGLSDSSTRLPFVCPVTHATGRIDSNAHAYFGCQALCTRHGNSIQSDFPSSQCLCSDSCCHYFQLRVSGRCESFSECCVVW